MKEITITNQKEWDELPDGFKEFTRIKIRAKEIIIIRSNPNNSRAELWDNSSAELRNNSSAVLWGNSSAVLYNNSSAVLWGNSSAMLYNNSSAVLWGNSSAMLYNNSSAQLWDNSSAELYNNSSAVLYNNSSAVLWDNSSAVLYNNSSAVLWDNSSAQLWDNSSAQLYNNSSAVLYNNSSAVLWGNSSAELSDNSSARAWERSCVHLMPYNVAIEAGDNVTIYNHCQSLNQDNITTESAVNVIHKENFIGPTFEKWLERGYVVADGIRQKLLSKKSLGEVTIYETQNFKKQTFYVAQRGDKFAHAESVEKAISDLRFKISDRDLSEFESWKVTDTKSLDEILEAYRAITGACETGIKLFCEKLELKEEYKISEIIEITKDAYGGSEFREFLYKK